MMRQATTTTAAALAMAGAVALSASAQTATKTPPAAASGTVPATPGGLFTSGGPVDVGADQLQQFQNEGRLLYTGNVDVVQGTARLRAPLMNVYTAKKAPGAAQAPQAGDMGSIERIEVEGPLYYVTPTQQVKGDHGTYLAADDTITVTGNVTLLQGQDVLHGDKLVIEQKTGHSTLTTNSPGKGPQRVRGVFFPKDKPAPGSPAAPTAAPAAPAAAPRA